MTKNKYLSIFILIFLFSSFSLNNQKTIKGYIHSYGNMPFNYPAIELQNGKVLKIKDMSKYTKEELFSLQGHLLKITGKLSKEKIDKNKFDYFIEIDEIEIVD